MAHYIKLALIPFIVVVASLFSCSSLYAQCANGPTANFDISGSDNDCASLTKSFTNKSTGDVLTFKWDFGNPNSTQNTSTATDPTHKFVAPGLLTENFTIELTVTDSAGCTDKISKTIILKQSAGAVLVDPAKNFTNCTGRAFAINVFDGSGLTPPDVTDYKIIWGDGTPDFSGSSFPAAGIAHNYTTQNVFNLKYIVTSINGCIDTAQISVGNMTNPSVSSRLPIGATGCAPFEICFPIEGFEQNHPLTTYEMDYGDGSPLEIFSHPPQRSVCHTYIKSACGNFQTSFDFKITAKNQCTQSGESLGPIKVSDKPFADFRLPLSACENTSITITNNSKPGYDNLCLPEGTYVWDFGDGSPKITTFTKTNPRYSYTKSGVYDVILSVSGNCGDSSITKQICVEKPLVSSFTTSGTQGCVPLTITTDNISDTIGTCLLTRTWKATLSNKTCEPSTGKVNFIGGTRSTSFEPQFEIIEPGIYDIVLSNRNSCGIKTDTVEIVAGVAPIINIDTIPDVCAGGTISPTAQFNNCGLNITNYKWDFAGANTITSNSAIPGTINYPGSGTFMVKLAATNMCGITKDSTIFSINSLPPGVNPSTNLPVCEGQNLTLFADTVNMVTYNWSGPNGFTSKSQNPVKPNITINDAGTYSVFASRGGCVGPSQDLIITVNPGTIVSAGLDKQFCESEPQTVLLANPVGGTWSGLGIVNSNSGLFDPSLAKANSLNDTIVYTFTDNNACLYTDTVLIKVHPLPDLVIPPLLFACQNLELTFTNNSTNVKTHSWDFGDNSPLETIKSPKHTYTSVGNFNYKYVATSQFGCKDSIIQPILVTSDPFVDFVMDVDSACGPFNVNFTNKSTLLGGPTFAWDFGNGQTSVLQDPQAISFTSSLMKDTMYTVKLTFTNACGVVEKLDSIKVMPKPLAVIGTISDIGCSPFTVDFFNNSLGLPDTYDWDFGNGQTSNLNQNLFSQLFLTGSKDTTYQVRLIVTNECGRDTAYRTITVKPNKVTSFFNTNMISGCAPLKIDFESFSGPTVQHFWSFGDGNIAATPITSNVFADSGSYTVRLIVNDGCSLDTSFRDIQVFPNPNIDFSMSTNSVCVGVPVNFTNLSNNVSSLSWNFGDGNTSVLTNTSNSFNSSGSYNIVLSGTSDLYNCVSSTTKTLEVVQKPTSNFQVVSDLLCAPSINSFTNTSSNYTYSTWNFGDGASTIESSPSHSFTSQGLYSIKLVVENNIGCKDSVQQTINVHPAPSADFNIVSIDSCNLPSNAVFSNNSLGAIGYEWNFGNNLTSTLTNPSTSYDTYGTFFVKLKATNQYNCTDSIIKAVNIFQPPTADFTLSNQSVCFGEQLFASSSSIQSDSIKWFMGDGIQLTSNSFQYNYTSPGEYMITLVAYGEGGCSDTMFSTIPFIVNPKPVADFQYVNAVEKNQINGTINFFNLSTFSDSYIWHFQGDSTSTAISPTYKYNNFGKEIVTLISFNNSGCRDSISKLVEVDYFKGLYVPNALYLAHPNFEVSHFIPKGVGLFSYYIGIYDGWGNLMWESTAIDGFGRPTESWDGTYKGEFVQQDAYVWKIDAVFLTSEPWEGKEYENGKFKKSGTITVIK